jgi:hypothetical protein
VQIPSWQRLSHLDAATKFGHDMGKPVEVFPCRVGHDVAVLRSADDTSRPQRQASNDDEANIGLDYTDEKLVERRRTQRARRAESRNSNSLRVNEIVSLRFTTSGRCPSARRRSRRTRSPSESGDCCVNCSTICPNLTEPIVGERVSGRYAQHRAPFALSGRMGRSEQSANLHPGSHSEGSHFDQMAEREGFEPSMEFNPHTRLAGECLQPLGHLSRDCGSPV